MKGGQVFRSAVSNMVDVARQAIAKAGLDISDIDLFIPHQANGRIIRAVANALELAEAKVFINVDRYGNMGAASSAVALCEAIESGRVKTGDHLVLVAFGAGLSWAAVVLKWDPSLPQAAGMACAAAGEPTRN